MTQLSRLEEWMLKRLLRKMISGPNKQQMTLFNMLWDLDTEVHYEDNEPTRKHWYLTQFLRGFQPPHSRASRRGWDGLTTAPD